MGAELIGYIIKGPSDISDKRQAAIEYIEHRNIFVRDGIEKLSNVADDQLVDYDEIFNGDDLVLEFLDIQGFGTPESAAELLGEELVIKDPAAFVDEFIAFWFHGARDTQGRIDPDDKNKIIVFAGDATWGDEPDGYGYSLIKKCFQCGIMQVFGIG